MLPMPVQKLVLNRPKDHAVARRAAAEAAQAAGAGDRMQCRLRGEAGRQQAPLLHSVQASAGGHTHTDRQGSRPFRAVHRRRCSVWWPPLRAHGVNALPLGHKVLRVLCSHCAAPTAHAHTTMITTGYVVAAVRPHPSLPP